jgi:hypothetical protein
MGLRADVGGGYGVKHETKHLKRRSAFGLCHEDRLDKIRIHGIGKMNQRAKRRKRF